MSNPEETRACGTCNGTGFVDSANPDIPIKPCSDCGGTGKVEQSRTRPTEHIVATVYEDPEMGRVVGEILAGKEAIQCTPEIWHRARLAALQDALHQRDYLRDRLRETESRLSDPMRADAARAPEAQLDKAVRNAEEGEREVLRYRAERAEAELERFAERVAGELEAKATGIVALTGRSGPKSDALREAASLIRNSAKGEG